MAGRPATLEGSLLARKGDAAPAIPDDSPLMDSVEGATSEVVPLHRVETSEPEPAQAAILPSVVHTARPASSRRRTVIILVGLLVLGLIAVALAFRGGGGARPGPMAPPSSGAISEPAPDRAVAARPAVPAPVAEAPKVVAPPEAPAPTPEAGPPIDQVPPAAAGPQSAAPAPKKPDTVTPVLAPTPPSGRYVLQFASVGGERRARQEADRLQKRLGEILGGRKITVVSTEVRGRTRYRLRAGGFESLRAAISTCRKVARLKIECLPIRR